MRSDSMGVRSVMSLHICADRLPRGMFCNHCAANIRGMQGDADRRNVAGSFGCTPVLGRRGEDEQAPNHVSLPPG